MDQTFGEEYDLMFQIVREQMMLRRAERNAQPFVIQLQRDENNEDHFTVVLGRGLQPTAPVAAPRPARPNHSSSPTGPSDAALMPILEEIGPLILQALVFQALLGDHRHRMAAPLDPSTLRELQRMKLSREIVARLEAEGQGVCSICQETFGASAYVYRLPCGHLFDLACLEMWLQRTRTCPNCRFLLQDVEQQYKDAVTPMWWLCENAEKNSDPNTASEVVVGQVKSITDNAPISHAEVLQTPSRWDTAFRGSSGVAAAQSASVSAVSIAVPNALHNSLVGTANLNEQNELDESSPLVLPLLRRSTHSRHGRAFQEANSYPQQVVAVADDEQPIQQQQQQQQPKPRPPPPPPSPQPILDTRVASTPPRTAESLQTLRRLSGRLGIPPNEGLPPLGEAHPTPVAPFGAPQAQENEAADHRRRVREWTPGGLSRSVSNSSGDVYIMPHTPPQVILNESNCPVAGNARQAVNAIRRYRVEDTARPRHRAVTAARAATRPPPPPPPHPPAHPPLPIERHHRPSEDRRTQGARHNGSIDNGSSQRAIGNAGQRNASDVTGENETREPTRRRHSGARGSNGGGNYRNLAQYEAIIRGQLRYPRGH